MRAESVAVEGVRLDSYASNAYELSRNQAQLYIESGNIQVNDRHVAKSYIIKDGDIVTCNIPEPQECLVLPEDIKLDIVYEDSDIIVVNKPQNMVVHPAPGHFSGTLVNALLYHCKDLSGINGVLRPGIVHRLDKDTSGLIVAAKNDRAHQSLAEQLSSRTMGRVYNAITHGLVEKNTLTINANIGRHPSTVKSNRKKMAVVPLGKGKEAITHISVLERYDLRALSLSSSLSLSLVEARLETGRTHQIRVHLAHIGHPVYGDPVYGPGNAKNAKSTKPTKPTKPAKPTDHINPTKPITESGQLLHAKTLRFTHPTTGKDILLECPLPDYFQIFS